MKHSVAVNSRQYAPPARTRWRSIWTDTRLPIRIGRAASKAISGPSRNKPARSTADASPAWACRIRSRPRSNSLEERTIRPRLSRGVAARRRRLATPLSQAQSPCRDRLWLLHRRRHPGRRSRHPGVALAGAAPGAAPPAGLTASAPSQGLPNRRRSNRKRGRAGEADTAPEPGRLQWQAALLHGSARWTRWP